MKGLKIFAVCAAVILLLAPATCMAKGPRFSISLNLSTLLAPPPQPVIRERILVPCPLPPPYVEKRTFVKEYYYYGCDCPGCCETIQPIYPNRPFYPY